MRDSCWPPGAVCRVNTPITRKIGAGAGLQSSDSCRYMLTSGSHVPGYVAIAHGLCSPDARRAWKHVLLTVGVLHCVVFYVDVHVTVNLLFVLDEQFHADVLAICRCPKPNSSYSLKMSCALWMYCCGCIVFCKWTLSCRCTVHFVFAVLCG